MTRKMKSLSLQTSAVLLAALLAAGLSACSAENNAGDKTGQKIADGSNAEGSDAEGSDAVQAESEESGADNTSAKDAANPADSVDNSDTNVTSEAFGTEQIENSLSPVTVTFKETLNESKADDGKVIFTSSVQMPVVNIEGAADIAEKINADLEKHYQSFSTDNKELVETAKEDYAASLEDDGWEFLGYSAGVNTKVTRMDEAVISFQITVYDYTGGAPRQLRLFWQKLQRENR